MLKSYHHQRLVVSTVRVVRAGASLQPLSQKYMPSLVCRQYPRFYTKVPPLAHAATIEPLVVACCIRFSPQLVDTAVVFRQVQEMHQQAAAQTAEVRKLYDWRDVMKTVHNERLQEVAAKHQADRDSLLQTISQRSAACRVGCYGTSVHDSK